MTSESLGVRRAPDLVTRNVLTKTLWEARRSVIGWTLAIAAVGATYAAFWPTIDTPEMQQAMASYPEALLEAMNYTDMTSASGYIGSAVYGLLAAALVAVLAVSWGARTIAGEEEDGGLDLLLTHPVSRTRVALERMGALLALLLLVGLALWLVLLALRGPARLDDITAGGFAAASLQLALFGLATGAVSFAVGAATGRRGWALGAGAVVAVLGYLATGVFPQLEALAWTESISPWHWYLGGSPLRHGVQWVDCAKLAGLAAVLVAVGTWAFGRRDIGV